MTSAWILVGGRLVPGPALAALPHPDLVIAADGGARHATTLGVPVDLWVGDFDSSDGLTLDVPRDVHPRAKDSTDAELAIRLARERGSTSLAILGAFGGRFDHAFALALGAVRLAQEGLDVLLHSGDESGHPLRPGEPLHLTLAAGQTFSVLAAGPLHRLSIVGARWPLQAAEVPSGSGHTLSNEAAGGELVVQLTRGTALVTVLHPAGTLLAGDPYSVS
ncbi:thiamine diphosphokinase [Deinococcus sonorensis]|uniref:Thiamine diphosphokinase n=2 Tax=Deinococcus sonorensis TaxID=309891 RepID=A0AAU7U9N1_9DEIO